VVEPFGPDAFTMRHPDPCAGAALARAFQAGALAVLAAAAGVLAAAEPPPASNLKHLTVPFKPLSAPVWAPDGSHYTWEVEDAALGRLTLTVRIARVGEATFTVAADGTDWEAAFPLPPETHAGAVLRAKKKELGEPLNAKTAEALVRFCIAAGYLRYAEAELAGPDIPEAARKQLAAQLRQKRARSALEAARELACTGQFEEAGRLLAEAAALAAEPPEPAADAERWKTLVKESEELQVQLSAEVQARRAWQERVQAIRAALEGAQGAESALIERLLPDLEGPLPGARRRAILERLHADQRARLNYSQALDALKELSFAVRYGEELRGDEHPGLDAFFAAESLVNVYLEAPAVTASAALEKVLALRGLSDQALAALIRRGRRVPPPPAPAGGQLPQGPFALRGPTADHEVALDYLVMLPTDYHPSRNRPLLIALHGTQADAKGALQFWAPEALKRGWLVAAPECPIGKGRGYLGTPEERALVLRALDDCLRRFAVDANRVYLTGHSMGAYAVWDVALTYPDRFAAAVAIAGCANGISANYLPNLLQVPFYAVGGTKDEAVTKVNRLVREELAKLKLPWTYAEFFGRGHETFAEEIPKICAWLDGQARPRAPARVDFVSGDVETSRVQWLSMLSAEPHRDTPATGSDRLPLAIRLGGLARLTGVAKPGNVVEIQARNLRGVRIWLAEGLFDPVRPQVSLNGKLANLPADAAASFSRKRLLELVRQTGDRERLYWGTLDLPVPK